MTGPAHLPGQATQSTATALQSRNLGFRWGRQRPLLTFPDLDLQTGEHLFLHGPSGSGKSTLLSLLAGLQRPTTGELMMLGEDVSHRASGDRDRFRADHLGVIFQQFNLVPYLTPLANVLLPTRLSPLRRQRATPTPTAEAASMLGALAIAEDHWQRPVSQLSIGQQQRVAAARALTGAPEIILADEPTSALDADNRDRFIELLLTLAKARHTSVIFVSHDLGLAHHFHHQVRLEART